MRKKPKHKPKALIKYEICEYGGDIIHRQGSVDIDTGFESIKEIIRKL